MFLLDSIPDRICGYNAWNRRTQNTFKAFYALNSTNSRKQYVHSILLHFSFYFIPYRECKDSNLVRYFQRFYALIFSQLDYILKYIISGVWERLCTLLSQETYGCGGNYHISLCLVHRLQFTRIENIWLDCAFQVLCQDTNLFAESIILPNSFQLTSFLISGNKANKLSRSFRFRKPEGVWICLQSYFADCFVAIFSCGLRSIACAM